MTDGDRRDRFVAALTAAVGRYSVDVVDEEELVLKPASGTGCPVRLLLGPGPDVTLVLGRGFPLMVEAASDAEALDEAMEWISWVAQGATERLWFDDTGEVVRAVMRSSDGRASYRRPFKRLFRSETHEWGPA